MRCRRVSKLGEPEAHRLSGPKQDHTHARSQEQQTPPQAFNKERRSHRNRQVPNLQDTIDEKLCGWVGDADSVEDLVEVV